MTRSVDQSSILKNMLDYFTRQLVRRQVLEFWSVIAECLDF
jgi:hypothetical protein